jgi:hypothetical protein
LGASEEQVAEIDAALTAPVEEQPDAGVWSPEAEMAAFRQAAQMG